MTSEHADQDSTQHPSSLRVLDLEARKSPEGLTVRQENLALLLLKNGMVMFEDFPFRLHSTEPGAPRSGVYFDLRLLQAEPIIKMATAVELEELVTPLAHSNIRLAGIPVAATPLVSTLSDRILIGMVTPRPAIKEHGTRSQIDGLRAQDQGKPLEILVIDDVITTGDSIIVAARTLRSHGFTVEHAAVVVDREEGGRERLERESITLHAIFRLSQILNFYRRAGHITPEQYEQLMQREEALKAHLAGA